MNYEVESGSLQWAQRGETFLRVRVKGEGEAEFHPCTISKYDPCAEFAEIFAAATADPPAYGAIGDYVEPEPAPAWSPPDIVRPPVVVTPPPVLPPIAIDWDAECARFVAAIFSVRGQSVRGSMNIWAATVAMTPAADRSPDDMICAEMAPALNAWEGACFAERARVAAIDGATLADVAWPPLPAGAAAFIEICAQG